ncbi:hypothetical protein [Nonomuraea sp. NPDC049028]
MTSQGHLDPTLPADDRWLEGSFDVRGEARTLKSAERSFLSEVTLG